MGRERIAKRLADLAFKMAADNLCSSESVHDGRLLGLFLPEGSKSHFLAHRGVVYILNEARH